MTCNPMQIALDEARKAGNRGEVPVGAVVVNSRGEILSKAGNCTRELFDPTAHAEVIAIREACQVLKRERLVDCDLYVTLEPCPMCAASIGFARIRRLYYGASDPKSGGVEQGARVFHHDQCHHKPDIYNGIGERDSSRLLQAFFKARR